MDDAVDELVAFLERNGCGPWVTDALGRNQTVQEWAGSFVDEVLGTDADEATADAERMAELRTMLDEKPDRKTISVPKVRAIIDPQQ
jgi:hypothetical protein